MTHGIFDFQTPCHETWYPTHPRPEDLGGVTGMMDYHRLVYACHSQLTVRTLQAGAENCDANLLLAGSIVGNPFSSVLRLHLPCRLLTGNSTRMEDQDISQLDDTVQSATHDDVSGSALITRNGKRQIWVMVEEAPHPSSPSPTPSSYINLLVLILLEGADRCPSRGRMFPASC
ncbi:hypothetical protein BO83DRAFT_389214 [Aspergillus eucalypticola CBS 122712]|uniref:Uncharacterized protein n=1 Tax=Aspergillus eucalypticola (strain CBS 122712 / IBT 29274) TaxID=1448314 RepID=A0A317VC95_ASPEC|nr:uncharacterized protein BO83DRAFT_389214 [Aspergillus eucalypticola CBS 122712]PWY71856.1 hypothetical protein BO83DRAFT_389214 [Aspergillus eucalypticola CBS 122712]